MELRSTLKVRGLKPEDFEARFGCSPKEAGFVLRDLRHPFSKARYKGILVIDDGSLGTCGIFYELVETIELSKDETYLNPAEQLRATQAHDYYAYLMSPSVEDQDMKMVRNCSTLPSEIDQKVASV